MAVYQNFKLCLVLFENFGRCHNKIDGQLNIVPLDNGNDNIVMLRNEAHLNWSKFNLVNKQIKGTVLQSQRGAQWTCNRLDLTKITYVSYLT